jgi:diguanylate cyclase (GGDEF)-like protein
VDLDRLREVNDTFGHETGDRALRALGRLLRESVRATDFAGRYGADDFVLLLAATPLPRAVERAQHLAASKVPDIGPGTGVTIGLAPIDDEGALPACRAADRALHRAKRLGGSRVEAARPDDYLESGRADP